MPRVPLALIAHRLLPVVIAAGVCLPILPLRAASAPRFGDDASLTSFMPEREKKLIQTVEQTRQSFAAARTPEQRQQVRLDWQIATTRFAHEQYEEKGWVGFVRMNRITRDGEAALSLEIAPGILISTFQNRDADPEGKSLIGAHSPLYEQVNALTIGEPVQFDAVLLLGRISTDEEMVNRPELIARFTKLKSLDPRPAD